MWRVSRKLNGKVVGSGMLLFGPLGKRYKLFWMESKAKSDGVGIFVAEKWVDSVVKCRKAQ